MHTLIILRPDDWHVHFRDAEALQHTVPATATHFARALVMPNLAPALTTLTALKQYRSRIMAELSPNTHFIPYMTLYLNETITPDDIYNLKQDSFVLGAKLYPAGATTFSSEGVQSIQTLYPIFKAMEANNLVLQIHGEITSGDIFERETVFIKTQLTKIMRNFPRLRIVLEHISTKAAVDFIKQAPNTLAATITPQHLLYNRNQLLVGGIKPHYYCLPILKHESDQLALKEVATSGHPRFFAGTDSAPHAKLLKESACGCAGIYSAPFAVALYTELFDEHGKLNHLESFLSRFGAEFYQLPPQTEQIMLMKQPQMIPNTLPIGQDLVVPLGAGNVLQWSIHDPS